MEHSTERSDIILIGPIRAGKSTIGRLLAEKLDVPQVSMDGLCWDYYREIGFYEPGVDTGDSNGLIASRYLLHALERLLADHRDCVIDLGGGHSVYRETADLARLQRVLELYPNVVLLLPSPDLKRSAEILVERNMNNDWLQGFIRNSGWNLNEHFLCHPSNRILAKHIVYTERKTPEQTRDEILMMLTTVPQNTRP